MGLQTLTARIRILGEDTVIAEPIELPHPPEFSGDCKELLNFISKGRSKLAGESSRYTDDQHKLRYVYGFLKGNAQNQIEPYVLADKINLQNVEALISILEDAFGDPDQVGTTSTELDKLTQGTLDTMSNQVVTYSKQWRLKESEELAINVVKMAKWIHGEDDPKTLLIISNLARVYFHQGRVDEAEGIYLIL